MKCWKRTNSISKGVNMVSNKERKILVVDDSQTNLALLKVHLTQMHLNVLLADNSTAAIEIAIKEKPDLILLDIMMPDINGFETCKMLKKKSEDRPYTRNICLRQG